MHAAGRRRVSCRRAVRCRERTRPAANTRSAGSGARLGQSARSAPPPRGCADSAPTTGRPSASGRPRTWPCSRWPGRPPGRSARLASTLRSRAAFEHWDAGLLRNIAEHGYFAPHVHREQRRVLPRLSGRTGGGSPHLAELGAVGARRLRRRRLFRGRRAGPAGRRQPGRPVPARQPGRDLPHDRVRRGPVPRVRHSRLACRGARPLVAGGAARRAGRTRPPRCAVPDSRAGRHGPGWLSRARARGHRQRPRRGKRLGQRGNGLLRAGWPGCVRGLPAGCTPGAC